MNTTTRTTPYSRNPGAHMQKRKPAIPATPAIRSLPVCRWTLAMVEKATIKPMTGKTR